MRWQASKEREVSVKAHGMEYGCVLMWKLCCGRCLGAEAW